MNLMNRFWSKVDKSGDCWEWRRGLMKGYGGFRLDGKTHLAHRVAWQLTNGPIPEGLNVCHSCDNPLCCRPDHLWLGTHADNQQDKVEKGRQAKGEINGQAKLTERDIPRIRDMLRCGARQVDIADWFGIDQAHVSSIKTGRCWKWCVS